MAIRLSLWERWRLWLAGATALFFVIGSRTYTFWSAYFSNAPDRSWDGSGHVALLQIYDRTIFPETFGWTNAFFAGMPFPNFYPPLWYWSISALHHLGSPLTLTYKIVLLASMLLVPLVLARLSFLLTGSIASSCATIPLCLIPLIEVDMMPRYAGGLTFSSTFNEGIYTEPLGFLLLILAITSLIQAANLPSCVRTGLLLAGTMLANVFTFVAALPFFLAVCLYPASKHRAHALNVSISLATTGLLTAFWIVPVLTHYKYFVTVPVRPPLIEVSSPALWCWLAAGFGSSLWAFVRLGERMKVYVIGLFVLLVSCICAYAPGLEGLPLQLPRLVAILAVLLTLPIASATGAIIRGALKATETRPAKTLTVTAALVSGCLCFAAILPLCSLDARIRSREDTADMDALLDFAKDHNDGRYMVQTPHLHRDRFEARAITSYLGSQGNEAATVVFRESSIASIFYVPLENKLSSLQQAFGVSSSLDNDLAFLNESPDLSDSQLHELGVRYLVRLKKEEWKRSANGATVFTTGRWEIVEVPLPPATETEALAELPVLVFSDISYKRRRAGQLEANRLFEEQFRSGDFTTRLALSPAKTIDSIDHLDSFGSLILNKFTVRDEDAAFTLIKNFSRIRAVVLLPDSSAFCHRLLTNRGQLPGLSTIEIDKKTEGGWLDEENASSPKRRQITEAWKRIDQELTMLRTARETASHEAQKPLMPNTSMLLHRTFDPSWESHDGSPIYLAGPSSTLLLSVGALPLSFTRDFLEKGALLISTLTVLSIAVLFVGSLFAGRRPRPLVM